MDLNNVYLSRNIGLVGPGPSFLVCSLIMSYTQKFLVVDAVSTDLQVLRHQLTLIHMAVCCPQQGRER